MQNNTIFCLGAGSIYLWSAMLTSCLVLLATFTCAFMPGCPCHIWLDCNSFFEYCGKTNCNVHVPSSKPHCSLNRARGLDMAYEMQSTLHISATAICRGRI